MNKNTLKSIGAIFAGMVTGAALSVGTDFALETAGVFPSPGQGSFIWWMLLLALVYRGIYTVASGYLTAALASSHPMRHAIMLGIVGVAVIILGSIANWERSAAWYPIALILITLPCTWLGGEFRELRIRQSDSLN